MHRRPGVTSATGRVPHEDSAEGLTDDVEHSGDGRDRKRVRVGVQRDQVAEGHVRVDIFYAEASKRTKALIDLAGAILLLLPFMLVLAWFAVPSARV